jgi:hypothetical protein
MASRFDQPIEPMMLGNMRELGVRSLDVSRCRHSGAAWSAPAAASSVPTPDLKCQS